MTDDILNTDLHLKHANGVYPDDLMNMPRWLLYAVTPPDDKGKQGKIPYYSNGRRRTGKQGSGDDLARLVTFEQARQALIAGNGKYTGLGYAVIAGDDIAVIDIDYNCTNGDKTYLLNACQSYTEKSLSGKGGHIFVKSTALTQSKRNNAIGLEFFASSQFIAMTGNHVEKYGTEIKPLSPDVETWLKEKLFHDEKLHSMDFGDDDELNDFATLIANQPKGIRLDGAKHLLGFIDDNSSYDRWLAVGMALHHEFKGTPQEIDALDLWNEWSETAENYKGYDDLANRWRSFSDSKAKPKTMATLIKIAKQHKDYTPIKAEYANKQALQEWTTPQDFNQAQKQDTPYPIEAFTPILKQAIEAIAHHAQTPVAMAGQAVLGALSTIGQKFVNAPMPNGQYMPSSLFLLTEGGSGEGKTQASRLAQHAIKQHDKPAYCNFLQKLEAWELEVSKLNAKQRAEYIANHPKPRNETIVFTDATIEAVLDRFIIDGIKNQSWTTDEAATIFNGYSMKADTAGNALASLTSLWSTGTAQRLRSQRGKNATVKTSAYEVRLTLDLQGQRVILEQVMNSELMNEQGFLARFLVACPDSIVGQRQWNTPERMTNLTDDDPRLQAYWQQCTMLLGSGHFDHVSDDLSVGTAGENLDFTTQQDRLNMPFANADTRQALADYQQSIEQRLSINGDLAGYKAFASRMAENASRIATLMAFFDCSKSLTVDYLQRAFKLVEYSMAERKRYATLEKSNAQKLWEWLVKTAGDTQPPKVNRCEASQYAPYGLRGKKLQEPLEELEQMELVQIVTNGRKKEIFLHPERAVYT